MGSSCRSLDSGVGHVGSWLVAVVDRFAGFWVRPIVVTSITILTSSLRQLFGGTVASHAHSWLGRLSRRFSRGALHTFL